MSDTLSELAIVQSQVAANQSQVAANKSKQDLRSAACKGSNESDSRHQPEYLSARALWCRRGLRFGLLLFIGLLSVAAWIWLFSRFSAPRILKGHVKNVLCVAVSPDSRYVVTGGRDETLRLWDLETGEQVARFDIMAGHIDCVAYSPDGTCVLFGTSGDGALRLLEIESGEEVLRFGQHEHCYASVAFSPDGHHALVGSGDSTMRLFDLKTGKEIRRFEGHTGRIRSVAYSPDGRFAVSGSSGRLPPGERDDHSVRLWDIETAEELCRFEGHTDSVGTVAFSPDGRLVLSGSRDRSMRLWDCATGGNLHRFDALTEKVEAVESVSFSCDGRQVLLCQKSQPPCSGAGKWSGGTSTNWA